MGFLTLVLVGAMLNTVTAEPQDGSIDTTIDIEDLVSSTFDGHGYAEMEGLLSTLESTVKGLELLHEVNATDIDGIQWMLHQFKRHSGN